jgi:glutamate racemase
VIGLFDSGLGGLAVMREVRTLLPMADLIYVADRGRAPYGPKTLEQVRAISHDVATWLVDAGADCLVVACNTASAAALETLRQQFPDLPVVGMEPAVKPAAAGTATGTVAVFATAATFQGELFNSVVRRFADGVVVLTRACPEWVELVERGVISGPEAEETVRSALEPAIAAGADRIVLACTHFSFLRRTIETVSSLEVIDPAPAVAAQVARVAPTTEGDAVTTLAASGDLDEFERLAWSIAAIEAPVIPFPA